MNPANQILRVGFTGDISFTGIFGEKALKCQDITEFFDTEIIKFLAKNDWNVGNVEGPLTVDRPQKYSGVALRSPPKAARLLRRLRINCYNLANNHTMDYGVQGLRDTFGFASRNDALLVGAGMDISQASCPIIFEKSDIKVGLLAISHNEGMLATNRKPGVFAEKCDELIHERISELRSECDWVILNYHGGEEYTFVPLPLRRRRLLRYLDYGADIIVAHHPHVVQGYEHKEGKCIFYSLGNFVFDIPEHAGCKGTDESVLISLLFGKKSYDVVKLSTRSNLIAGRVESTSTCKSYAALISDIYQQAWEKEALRIIADRFSTEGCEQGSIRIQAVLCAVLLKIRRTLGIIRRLNNPIFRYIFVSACKCKLTNVLKR